MADVEIMSEETAGAADFVPVAVLWTELLEPYAGLAVRGRNVVLHRLGLSLKDARDFGAAYCAALVAALIFLA